MRIRQARLVQDSGKVLAGGQKKKRIPWHATVSVLTSQRIYFFVDFAAGFFGAAFPAGFFAELEDCPLAI
jgi:hypothetical protein